MSHEADILRAERDYKDYPTPRLIERIAFLERNRTEVVNRAIELSRTNRDLVQSNTAHRVQADEHAEKLAALQRTNDNQRDSLNQFRQKWSELNEHMNEAATNADLCSEYEATIDDWNSRNGGMYELYGRETEDTYTVTVRVSAMRPHDVTPMEDDARWIDSVIQDAARDYIEGEGLTNVDVSVD